MLSADEPRYAAIGREMARSGDWITPRLWGSAWFEKPPLLYWMTGIATLAGLGMDLAPRLPVALLGFGFLIFFYIFLREEFGENEALFATCVLGTSAAWIAESFAAVTDLPLAATFAAALLLSLRLERRASLGLALVSGALLGFAMLAKGLVPLVLYAPVCWLLRRRLPSLFWISLACIAIAGPWYALCTLRNGAPFVDEFIWKHHFQRFTSAELQHVRPFWFYVPVLLAALFPWTPALLLLPGQKQIRFLAIWIAYALLFFSAAQNKLPGYVLPLMPALAVLIGIAIARAGNINIPLALSGLLIGFVPAIAAILPQALAAGLSHTAIPQGRWIGLLIGIACAVACVTLEKRGRRADAVVLVAVALAIVTWKAKLQTLPTLDQTVSASGFYRRHLNGLQDACLQGVPRASAYGLAYYADRVFPDCKSDVQRPKVLMVSGRLMLVE